MLSVYRVFWPQNLCLGNTCGFNHLNVVWASFGAIPIDALFYFLTDNASYHYVWVKRFAMEKT